jgi:tripartite-type tricarboxylate transporter receptor subunit TctC
MIVGVPPGGTTDIMGRSVAAKLAERLGRQVVVDNRTGASGIIAIQLVVSSQPDGYTLLISGSSITAVGSLYPNVRFDVSREWCRSHSSRRRRSFSWFTLRCV